MFNALLIIWNHLFLESHLKWWPYCIVSVSLLFGNTLCFCASDIWNNWSILLFRNYLKRYLSFTLCWNILCFCISDIWLIWLTIVDIVFCPLWHINGPGELNLPIIWILFYRTVLPPSKCCSCDLYFGYLELFCIWIICIWNKDTQQLTTNSVYDELPYAFSTIVLGKIKTRPTLKNALSECV